MAGTYKDSMARWFDQSECLDPSQSRVGLTYEGASIFQTTRKSGQEKTKMWKSKRTKREKTEIERYEIPPFFFCGLLPLRINDVAVYINTSQSIIWWASQAFSISSLLFFCSLIWKLAPSFFFFIFMLYPARSGSDRSSVVIPLTLFSLFLPISTTPLHTHTRPTHKKGGR